MVSPIPPVRVLVVEDEPAQRRLIEIALSESPVARFAIEGVATLQAGLDALDRALFDLVVVDLGLPDARGTEAVDGLHAHAPMVPIVVCSGADDMRTAYAALDAGAEDFVLKDLQLAKVLPRAVMQALERRRLRAALADRNAEVRALTDGITHDLRAPIVALDYLIDETEQMVDEDELDAPRLKRYLGRMHDAVETLDRFVDDILAIARVDRAQARYDPLDLVTLVRETLVGLSDTAEERGVAIHVDAHRPVPVEGDARLLRHLVHNLVHNAIKFGRDGDGTVHVRIMREADPTAPARASVEYAPVRLEVHDDGPGIPVADRERVFALFERGSGDHTGKAHGSGLGLAVAQRIALRHGGRVEVDESPYGGACFTVRLPGAERGAVSVTDPLSG